MSERAHDGPSSHPSEQSAATSGEADEDLLAELADDFAARARRGERPAVEEYAARHPGLAERIRKVFPAIVAIEGTRSDDPPAAAPGETLGGTIGRYKLLERIGEGGFGVVYMAEQHHPVRRRVALKVVKPGMDSRQVLARFDAERQALAIMDHPNIAKVFDGGMTDSGRPYFVMELVKGEPITEYCDRNLLPPRQRLALFAQVCHAVQHAHQKGIIHRDIKPTNVLVAVHDTTPVVKVIDFGVAKALGQELTEKTLFTGFAQLLGTPLYMSPEQAGHSALDVDTRSDIYSLGVLLYELLTGTTPFDKERFRKAAHDEIRRIIRDEEPPRPSTRLSESKASLPSISAQRQTEPAKLTRLVRGELDWIVMKALEKDRNRRYETANGLAADVRRYLADEPVSARSATAGYRLRKFASKHKVGFGAAAAVAGALVLGVVGTTLMMFRATRERDRAVGLSAELDQQRREAVDARTRAEAAKVQAERDRAAAKASEEEARENLAMMSAVVGFLNNMFAAADPEKREPDVTVRQMLDRTVAQIDRDEAKYPARIQAAVRHALGTAYNGLGRVPEAETQLRKALGLRQAALPANHPVVGKSLGSLGILLSQERKFDDALPLLEQARDIYRQANLSDSDVLAVLGSLRHVHDAKGNRWESERYAREQAELRSKLVVDKTAQRMGSAFNEASVRMGRNDNVGAERLLREAIDLHRQSRKGRDDRLLITMYHNLGVALARQGRHTDAETPYEQALAASEKLLGKDHPEAAGTLNNLAMALRAQGKEEQAHDAELRRIAIQTSVPGDSIRQRPDDANLYRDRGRLLCRVGRFADAVADFDKAMELDPDDAGQWYQAAAVYLYAGDVDRYRRACRELLDRAEKLATDNPTVAEQAAKTCALAPGSVPDFARVERLAERCVTGTEEHPLHRNFALAKGLTDYRGGRHGRAVEWLQRFGPRAGGTHVHATAFAALSTAHLGLGRPEQASASLQAARAIIAKKPADAMSGSDWFDWLHCEILCREAEGLMGAVSPQDLAAARQRRWDGELTDLTQAVERQPDTPDPLAARAKWLLAHGRFDGANADYARLLQLDPGNHWHWYYRGCVLAYLGREKEYHEHCRAMLAQFADTDDTFELDRTTKTALLLPPPAGNSGAEAQAGAEALARRAARVAQSEPTQPWPALLMGMAEYRAGRPEAAVRWLGKFHEIDGGKWIEAAAAADAFLALAHHQLGRPDEAHTALRGAAARVAELPRAGEDPLEVPGGSGVENWLIAHAALREAEATVLGRHPPDPPQATDARVPPPPPPRPTAPSPFGGKPAALPGVVQAEDFDEGGEGVAYHDTANQTEGSAAAGRYRPESVDLAETGGEGGGYYVGWAGPGEWLAYTVQVKEAGVYDIDLRVASIRTDARLHVELDGKDVTGPLAVPNTGAWNKWDILTAKRVRLPAGRHVLAVVFDSAESQLDLCNLNWFEVRRSPE